MDETIFSTIQNRLMEIEKQDLLTSAIMTEMVLSSFQKDKKDCLLAWAKGENIENFVSNAISVKDVMEEIRCSAFQALCILNATAIKEDCYADATFVLWEDAIFG